MMNIPRLLLLVLFVVPLSQAADGPAFAVYEMRTYHAHEGKLEALHARFQDHTVALFAKHGMGNIIYLAPEDKSSNTMSYLLGYRNLEARKTAWKAFRDDPVWKAAYAASRTDGPLVDKVDSSFLVPTDYSPAAIPAGDGRLFELRTYTTNEGKLDALDARFRDHTLGLFAKHGIENVIYLHPAEGQEGAGNTLIYLVAHKDHESRKASFAGFGQDPAWKAARTASEANGKLLIKGGIENRFFNATDYSPVK